MFLKLVIPVLFIVSVCILGPLFFVVYANSMQENVSATGEYSGLLSFMNDVNYLIAVVLSNIGYIVALLLIVGVMIGAIVLIGAKYAMG